MTYPPSAGGGYGGPNPIGGPGPGPGTGQSPGSWPQPPTPQPQQPAPSYGDAHHPPPQPHWQPGPPPYGPPGYGPPPPGRGRNKRLIIGLVSGVVVLVVAVVVAVVVFGSGGPDSPKTAGDVVKAYLEALARGDADKALSYSNDEPASKEFLTDDILKQQIAKWPITNIRILNDDSITSDMGTVHVAANFGDQTSDENLHVKKVDGAWKLEHAAIKLKFLDAPESKALSTVTLFGKPFDAKKGKETYVFPGWIDLGNSNEFITQEPLRRPLLLGELGYAGLSASLMPQFDISDKGKSTSLDLVRAAIATCAQSKQLQPPNCPQGVRDPSLVDGTAVWTAPTDLSEVQASYFDPTTMTEKVHGPLDFKLTAQATSGGTKSGTVYSYITATVDLTTNPPTVSVKG
ncbi:hypothetical protein FHT44_006724 [Mycolicibacterium sp. BK634]|uniref:DUF4878 domain-containing protein n=1 Tax=Mycolicibacterium sp. BK634 TaxID=2587099 RepID=UPI00160AE7F0|nr:DUF4878 domain-containing protein [Mycolicibacterium sp. BK634]MBB3754202.1 hypothetical protein [Mycolicibacterium sp. BK634]